MMDHHQILSTLAEVAITLAALSGIAGVLSPNVTTTLFDLRARLLLRDVAGIGLAIVLLSLLPLFFEPGSEIAFRSWRWLSLIATAWWLLAYFVIAPQLQRLAPLRSRFRWVGHTATFAGNSLFIWNIAAPTDYSPQRYAGGLLCLLVIGGSNFLLAVFSGDADWRQAAAGETASDE